MIANDNALRGQTVAATQNESGRSYWDIVRTNLLSFFNLILFAVGILLILFGRYNDALITVGAGVAGTIVNVFQEIRAKRQLDQIRLLVRPVARLIRGDQEVTVDAAQLAHGDLIHLLPGDQAMADGVVIGEGSGEVDEALLTGESDPVRKQAGDKILSGSFCLNGDLVYQAEAVGAESFASQLTRAARSFTPVSTPLQQQVTLVIRLLMVLTVCMAFVFVSTSFIRNLSFLQNVAASAVLIGLIPYGFFLTINLAYSFGAIKLAKAGAVVQQTNAVEALHYVDVLCMDKTGTLTTNSLSVDTLQPWGVLTKAELARLLGNFAHNIATPNTTISALRHYVPGEQFQRVDEVPFAAVRKWSALAFNDQADHGVFVLGAPEMLTPYLAETNMAPTLLQQAQGWADQGLRVLLFAHNPTVLTLHNGDGMPALPALTPLGLVGLRDELRPHAGEILKEFSQIGVQLKIISGDNPQTVAALARQTGLVEPKLEAGPALAAMSAAEFEQAAEDATIFGRIAPEQKAQLVEALLKRGHYVAMIGDGVNDILALKKAKLGIAMQSGSSATRNVADMVLLNDSYAALAPALTEGKRIISGLTNATYLLITRALTYAFVIIGVLMVGLDFPFEPAQAGITAITVGLPSFFLTLWARPNTKEEPLLPSLLRFVLPVALWSMVIGVTLYTFVYFRVSSLFEGTDIPPRVIALFEQVTGLVYQQDQQFGLTAARIITQTALSVFLSFSALLLIFFLEPPFAWLACWRPVSPDRRPVWLALGLMASLVVSLQIPSVTSYLGFAPISFGVWRTIGVALVVWLLGLWLIWRYRWVDRLLALAG